MLEPFSIESAPVRTLGRRCHFSLAIITMKIHLSRRKMKALEKLLGSSWEPRPASYDERQGCSYPLRTRVRSNGMLAHPIGIESSTETTCRLASEAKRSAHRKCSREEMFGTAIFGRVMREIGNVPHQKSP
jgi:hypothetical protein